MMNDKKDYNVMKFYFYFFKKNYKIISLNILFETVLPIVEINLYRILTEEVLEDIQNDKVVDMQKIQLIMQDVLQFFKYFILIIISKFINKLVVNLIIPQFRILSRRLIFENYLSDSENTKKNTSLIITLGAMPMALYNVYKSILKFVLPLIALHIYISYSIYALDKGKIFVITILYCMMNLFSLALMIIYQSKLSSKVWSQHGKLVEKYNQFYELQDTLSIESLNEKILKEEQMFEQKRFIFYKRLNFLVYWHMVMFLFFSFYISFLFYKTDNPFHTKKVITLFLFCGKYFSTLIRLSKLTIESFGRIRILNDSLSKAKQ